MQHNNNNNNAIVDELKSVIIAIADIKTDSISESLEIIEKEISHLEKFSQEMNIPELRALTHWMMLNIELEDDNEAKISTLIGEGSYYNWMELLSILLDDYDQLLLPIIYKALTEPNWVVKPSAPLLRDLAGWIETSKSTSIVELNFDDSEFSNEDERQKNENLDSSTTEEADTDQVSSLDLDITNKHIFEDIKHDVLDKDYANPEVLKDFSGEPEENDSELSSEKSINYYDEIEDENIVDPTEEIFKAVATENTDSDELVNELIKESSDELLDHEIETILGDEISNSLDLADSISIDSLDIVETPAVVDISDTEENFDIEDESDDFNIEVDDIIMSLATINAESNSTFNKLEECTEELQRFEMLAEISGYDSLLPISNWCLKNLEVFNQTQSKESQQFIASGECWTWMELIKLAISEPEELSTISELNAELSREEWAEPLETEDLQSLLLFLHNPKENSKEIFQTNSEEMAFSEKTVEEITDEVTAVSNIEDNQETPEFSFNWDEDVHPELLEVYFEETTENVSTLSAYLENIGTEETSKEQRQDARRTAHTIKGGSAVVGITALSSYSYQLEKILDYGIDHELPEETNELLHTASSCLASVFEAIKDKKESPESFSQVHSNLMLCAEAIEELDDEPLELSAPVLPDFITQQNATSEKPKDAHDLTITEDINIETEFAEEAIELKENTDAVELIETENEVFDIETGIDTSDLISFNEETLEIDSSESDDIAIENSVSETSEEPEVPELLEVEEIDITLPTLDQSDEVEDFTAELDDIVMTLITTDVQVDKKPFKLDAYIEELHRLDILAEISGYPEVSTINSWYQNNLKLIAKKGTKKLGKFISSGESWAWIELVSASLADPDEISHLSELTTELTRSDWIEELDAKALESLLLKLKSNNNDLVQEEDTVLVNIETAQADISIQNEQDNDNIVSWDDDVHPELLSVYLQETSEQITKIAELLHLISKAEADKEQQEHAARIAHTIKGASGVVGITEIVNFTHKLEDILDYAVNNKISEETADLLAESSDCLESLFEAVQEKAAVPEEYESVLARLTEYADIIESDVVDIDSSSPELSMPELPDFITNTGTDLEEVNSSKDSSSIENKDNKTQSIQEATLEITKLSNELANSSKSASKSNEVSTNESHIRVPTALINKLLNLAGELVTTSSQVSDKVEKTIVTSGQIKDQDTRVHKMLNELSSTIHDQEKDQMTMLSSMQNQSFDTLEMDTYNELHSVAGLLTESILDSEAIENTLKTQLNEIHDDLRLLDNLNKELSETILNSRMESLNTLIPRLERIVRQTCRKTNKQAELIVTGNDINIDTEILTGLVDPLLHLLRNAIDHGIETPKERKTLDKSDTGQIHLDFSRQGNFIHMQLKDDGSGINSEKIYQHAINKGLITPEQEYSKSEVLKLILEPGFSTQTDVTDISGRGVGMDVVNKGIEALKGSLTIDTELGKGSNFSVRIPLTLVTSSTLLVETAGNKVAIPTDSIEQLFYLAPEDVLNRKDNKYIRHEGKELVIESLAAFLGWTASDVDFTKAQTLLLVKGNNQLHAIYIDQIIHSREVVIKSLAHFIDSAKGVIGACHLSDGEVAPVMNLPQLLSLNEQATYIVKQIDHSDIEVTTTNHTPQILVVDDSLSNRKALSLIIEKTEYDVITAVDGLDALNVMNEQHIDLVFTDLEMPRMTGLELTQAIRAWDEKKEMPIVMVTSRSTNKHRELAKKAGVDDYLTKPVGTETLLESIETWLKQPAEA